MKLRPALFRFSEADVILPDGECLRRLVMVPHRRFAELCKRQFETGEDYALGPVDNVSGRSRAHLFASLHDTWDNLPDAVAKNFPAFEHFRHWILVQVNHCTVNESVFDTVKDAKAHAVALRKVDEYAVISRSGTVVVCKIAKSIAGTAIKGAEFQKVKTDALDFAAAMIGTTAAALVANAGRSA